MKKIILLLFIFTSYLFSANILTGLDFLNNCSNIEDRYKKPVIESFLAVRDMEACNNYINGVISTYKLININKPYFSIPQNITHQQIRELTINQIKKEMKIANEDASLFIILALVNNFEIEKPRN